MHGSGVADWEFNPRLKKSGQFKLNLLSLEKYNILTNFLSILLLIYFFQIFLTVDKLLIQGILMEQDIRWKQRYQNYSDAFKQLEFAVKNISNPSDLEKEGTIQRFEFTHELAWKVMKDYLEYEGIQGITGSRSATREAFNKGLITNGQVWMDMIESRNKTVYTYLEEILINEYSKIIVHYFTALEEYHNKMAELL